ncbi:MAG: hypothetical protein NTY82_02060 [Actinobacteria bacterium]|nr:hypothetical protein [Actinomycetota bacterium]
MTAESHQDDLRLLRTNLEWVSRQLALAGEPFVGLAEVTLGPAEIRQIALPSDE